MAATWELTLTLLMTRTAVAKPVEALGSTLEMLKAISNSLLAIKPTRVLSSTDTIYHAGHVGPCLADPYYIYSDFVYTFGPQPPRALSLPVLIFVPDFQVSSPIVIQLFSPRKQALAVHQEVGK